MAMNNENKGLILDVLRTNSGTSNIIDKVTFYYAVAGSGALYTTRPDITWSATLTDGKLVMSGTVDIENTSGSTINVSGLALINSGAATLADTTDAVAIQVFGNTVALEDGEILRVLTLTYTID